MEIEKTLITPKIIFNYSERSDIPSIAICTLCDNPFVEPVLSLNCGHTYCQHCIQIWKANHKTCPLDETEVVSTVRNWSVENIVSKLKV